MSHTPLEIVTDPSSASVTSKQHRRETVVGNVLALDTIYIQQFTFLDDKYSPEFNKNVMSYTDRMLNDPDFGIVFFKAQIFNNSNVKKETELIIGDTTDLQYTLHFHCFAEDCLTNEKVQRIEKDFLPRLLTGASGEPLARLDSTDFIIHRDTNLRKRQYMSKYTIYKINNHCRN